MERQLGAHALSGHSDEMPPSLRGAGRTRARSHAPARREKAAVRPKTTDREGRRCLVRLSEGAAGPERSESLHERGRQALVELTIADTEPCSRAAKPAHCCGIRSKGGG